MQITISITNLDELKHFERMIPFYRSFLCHNVHFSCSNSYLPIYHFIEALTSKIKNKELFIFMILYVNRLICFTLIKILVILNMTVAFLREKK